VTDKGGGRFEVAYTVTMAGPVAISASLAGEAAARVFEARCQAASASLARCTVATVADELVAGQPGALVFWQADRHGSKSENHLLEFCLIANLKLFYVNSTHNA